MKKFINKLMNLENLSASEVIEAMEIMMTGEATHAQIGSFLTALKMKGETSEEISAFARVLRDKANRVVTVGDAIDIVGTGGDGSNTFNISTAAAFVTAAAGMAVAKHGNRAASSQCGTADVLEQLGCNISLTPIQAESCLEKTGICFLFAQAYHHSMKHVAIPRKELGIRTIFNLIGPLSNPAFVKYQLLGVASEELVEPMAAVLKSLDMKHAMVVHGKDGLDEITLGDSTIVAEVRDNEIRTYEIKPEDFQFSRVHKSLMAGGSARENADILRDVLSVKTLDPGVVASGAYDPSSSRIAGIKHDECMVSLARRDIVLLNAGAAIYVADKADTIAEGIEIAKAVIDSGAALRVLENYIDESMKYA